MTASNLIMEKLDEIKELTNSELALIDQLSVKVLPDKVVNQSERLKGAFINPVTSANGLPRYLAIRLEAINEILKEIQTNWNSTLPEATTHIDNIQSKLDELYNGVNDEYNTLLKIENAIKKEISDRQTAITNLINGASEDFDTLQEIETKVKQEISDREQAITNLINGASGDYDTLKELETAIKNEVTARSQAITSLIDSATANYNTLGKLEARIKEETANRNRAISALKGTVTSNNDTLGKLETNLNNEISNREDAIEALINNASSGYQTLKELEDKIKAEVTARTQAIAQEINDRNSAIKTAISNLVDTAPDLLNTLDELAAALGDDPNFATTVANNIAQSLTTAKEYTNTKISEEESARDTAISGAISNLKGAATTNYDTLAKLETRIKEETTNRTSAINSLIGGATENYNTLKELEDAIKAEVTNRTEAISALIGNATSSYDTLGKIQARIEAISGTEGEGLTIEGAITASMNYTDEKVAEEVANRNSAITALKNGASSGYDTLKELEDAIKAEVTNRASAITQEVSDRNSAITTAINNLKGTATTGYDTLGELESAIKAETSARASAITQAKTEVKNDLLGGAGAAFDTLNELAEALGNDPNFATTVSGLIGQKQDNLTENQLNAVNSGITQAKVAKYDEYEATINSKQNALNSTQQNAINSGITQAKVTKYDGYETTINSKANASEVVKKGNLGENVNFNDVTEGGMYRYNSSFTNGPDGASSHGQLLVVRGAEDTIAQLCFPYSNSRMFLRTGNAVNNPNGTWQGWVAISTEEYVRNKINEISDELILSVDCDHELEITGQTGHEYGKAIPDESNVVIREIHGQTRRKSLNYFNDYNQITLEAGDEKWKIWSNATLKSWGLVEGETYTIYFANSPVAAQVTDPGYNDFKDNVYTFTFSTQEIRVGNNNLPEQMSFMPSIMLVQGTYTKATMPGFDPYNNKLVNSKANLISTNKNLFDYNSTTWTSGWLNESNGSIISSSVDQYSNNYFDVHYLQNQQITLKFFGDGDINGNIVFYDYFKNYVSGTQGSSITITIPENAWYFRVSRKNSTKFSIVYGSTAPSEYILHLEDEVAYPELGAFDIAYPQANQIIRQTSQMITIDGSSDENWFSLSTSTSDKLRFASDNVVSASGIFLDNETINIASNFIDKTANQTWGLHVGISLGDESNPLIVYVEGITDKTSFMTWLQENPITFVYKLATPTIEEYNAPSGYKVWNGGLQAQLTDDTHVPYKLIKKEYSISMKAQVNTNASINSNQQEQIMEMKEEIVALKNNYSERPPITQMNFVGNKDILVERNYDNKNISFGNVATYEDFKITLTPSEKSLATCEVKYKSGDSGYIEYDFDGYNADYGLILKARTLQTIYDYDESGSSLVIKRTTFEVKVKDIYNNEFSLDFTLNYKALNK